MNTTVGDAAIAVVRRNTKEVQTHGDFTVFEELFHDDFVDHTPQHGTTPDKIGVRVLYHALRAGLSDFVADIQWQSAAGDLVTTFKIYRGVHTGRLLGVAGTGREVEFESVDVMRVVDGRITEHWGVGNLLKLMTQIGAVTL